MCGHTSRIRRARSQGQLRPAWCPHPGCGGRTNADSVSSRPKSRGSAIGRRVARTDHGWAMPAASPSSVAAAPARGRTRVRRSGVAEARPFDFLESRIQVPAPRTGTVSRTGLVNRMRASTSAAVATVVAPAGYGKTTLLAQWAARDTRRFAWVTVDDRDNDPVVLLRHIAAALAREEPLERSVVEALRSPRPTIWAAAVPRLAAELAARSPIVLVLDDANLLHARAALEAVEALIDDELEGSMVVLS